MDGHICDPDEFYYQKPDTEKIAVSIQNVINIFTMVLVFSVAPFLVITPFIVENLDTLSRKIIAMICASDMVNLTCTLVMAARLDDYKAAGDNLLYECTLVTFMQNTAPYWSLLWSFALLLGIWLTLVKELRPRKKLIFRVFNLIVWPLGIFIPLTTFLQYIYPWNINYNSNYLSSGGCQPNLTFVYRHNGTRCLLDSKGRSCLSSLYYLMLFFILATQVMFVCIYFRLRGVWKTFQVQANSSIQGAAGYAVAAKHSRETVISSIQFSMTGFIYIISYVPLFVKQALELYYGPPVQNKAIDLTLTVYFLTMDNFVGVMNVLFYGVFSAKFRREVRLLLKTLWRKTRKLFTEVRNPLRRSSSLISSSVHSRVITGDHTDFETDSDFN